MAVEDDEVERVNKEDLDVFIDKYFPANPDWRCFIDPKNSLVHNITLVPASELSPEDFESCYLLIKTTSSADYRSSSVGWKPKSKKREMRSDDLKYLLVKAQHESSVVAFLSFMPTMEDDHPVMYCYEVHLNEHLQGSGLGSFLMQLLEDVAVRIPVMQKVMLSCFTQNKRAVQFYKKRGYVLDEYSAQPRTMRNGTVIEPEYIIMSKDAKSSGRPCLATDHAQP